MNNNERSDQVVVELFSKLRSGEIDKKIRKDNRRRLFIAIELLFLLVTICYLSSTTYSPNLDNIAIPKTTLTEDQRINVLLEQNRLGHYIFVGEINGKMVKFLLDTGATNVSIPQKVANYIGLSPGESYFSQTANGKSLTYTTTLSKVKVGGISKYNIQGSISPGMEGEEILLGMSFLRDIEIVQSNGQIRLFN